MSALPEENLTLPLRLPKVEVWRGVRGVRVGVVALMTRLLSLGERESDCGRRKGGGKGGERGGKRGGGGEEKGKRGYVGDRKRRRRREYHHGEGR